MAERSPKSKTTIAVTQSQRERLNAMRGDMTSAAMFDVLLNLWDRLDDRGKLHALGKPVPPPSGLTLHDGQKVGSYLSRMP